MNYSQTRNWLTSDPYLRDEARRLALDALDWFESIAGASTISPEDLGPILAAARCRLLPAWDIAGGLLAELACQHQAAQEAFREWAACPRYSDRFHAIYCLRNRMPAALLQELLGRALNDRTKRVRQCAAQKCDTLWLQEMLRALLQRAQVEPVPEVRRNLEFHAAMLRDGYVIERRGKGLSLWVRIDPASGAGRL
jgi:hypothetical protein